MTAFILAVIVNNYNTGQVGVRAAAGGEVEPHIPPAIRRGH